MKSLFKRSAISVIVLGLSGTIYANANTPTYNPQTWTSQFTGAFIGVEGLDFRPMNGDLDYISIFELANNNESLNNKAINTNYNWNWRVYGGLTFSDHDDIAFSWTELRTSNNSSTSPSVDITTAPNNFSIPRWNELSPWENIFGRASFDLDDAYLVWGHTIHFNSPWSVRFAGGLEYAHLKSKLSVVENIPTLEVQNLGFSSISKLNGLGPRIEMDIKYKLPYGFALFAEGNAALFVGDRDISLNPINDNPIDTVELLPSFEWTNRHVVVPKVGARLGASYSYVWGQAGAEGMVCSSYSLTVDAGWEVETYIHAVERQASDVFLGSSSTFTSPSTKVSNFSDQGFFVGLKLGTSWL